MGTNARGLLTAVPGDARLCADTYKVFSKCLVIDSGTEDLG